MTAEPRVLLEWKGRPQTERNGTPYWTVYRIVETDEPPIPASRFCPDPRGWDKLPRRWIEVAVEYEDDTPEMLLWERDGNHAEADRELSQRAPKAKAPRPSRSDPQPEGLPL